MYRSSKKAAQSLPEPAGTSVSAEEAEVIWRAGMEHAKSLSKKAAHPLPDSSEMTPEEAETIRKAGMEYARMMLSQRLPQAPPAPKASEQTAAPDNMAPAPAPAAEGGASSSWRATPVVHDSYLTESQALAFAQYDVERKKQIQVAATKVLMQKLPTRDLRFLWAILYGGENAPWPGSSSAIIPGVTVPGGLSTFRLNPV